MFSSESSGAVNAVVNAASNAANGVVNTATNLFQSVNKAANSAVNTVAQNLPSFDSLIPIGNSSSGPSANTSKTNATNSLNNSKNKNNSFFNTMNTSIFTNTNTKTNMNTNINTKNTMTTGMFSWISWINPLYIFAGIVLVFLTVFAIYNTEIKQGYEYIVGSIRNVLNMPVDPDVTAAVSPSPVIPVTVAPESPQDTTPNEMALPNPSQTSLVERILPSSNNEVFNVAQNKFTYYDAEPLCRALGAELASYEQVKDAWGKGADWCNYGWVKGQMAIYPTQKGTYEKLQAGPPDERNACGTVGINGGYFENPEFKYGVNCYGQKPSQSAHDQDKLMSEGKAPKSPETLKVDALVREFREEADSLFVKPFNNNKWASS